MMDAFAAFLELLGLLNDNVLIQANVMKIVFFRRA